MWTSQPISSPGRSRIAVIRRGAAGEDDGAEVLVLQGADLDTPDGTCIRDYIHVSDLAVPHIPVLDHLERIQAAQTFNVGTGLGYSVREVLDEIGAAIGRPMPVQVQDRRPGDPEVVIADVARLQRVTGWRPQPSPHQMETSAESAFEHHSGHFLRP